MIFYLNLDIALAAEFVVIDDFIFKSINIFNRLIEIRCVGTVAADSSSDRGNFHDHTEVPLICKMENPTATEELTDNSKSIPQSKNGYSIAFYNYFLRSHEKL